MAFTRAPVNQTEQTKLIQLMEEFETRSPDGAKDVINQNVIWDQIQDETGTYFEAMKRDGCRLWATVPEGENVLGIHWRNDGAGIIVATQSFIYFYTRTGTQIGAPIPVGFGFGGYPIVRFTEFLYDDGSIDYVATNGDQCWVFDGTTNVAITDPDFPADFLPYPVFLDGYLFIATADGKIYNSAQNNPLSWAASDIITAESYADGLGAIARHGQYIAAFGRNSIQFFYDAANPTGTPLAAQTTVPHIGFVGGLTSAEDTLYFIGQGNNSKLAIYHLKSLKPEEVVSFPISRRITADGFSIEDAWGNIIVLNGHVLYTWRRDVTSLGGTDLTPTYALDLQTKKWCSLTFQQTLNFRIHASAFNIDSSIGTPRTSGTLFSFSNTRQIYETQDYLYQDAGVDFTVKFATRNQDFGTRRMKFGSRVIVNCDQTPTSSNMQLDWTVDDYQSYVPARTVNAALMYPSVHALGAFRKIAFRVTYTDNFPMRWRNLEFDYSQGDR